MSYSRTYDANDTRMQTEGQIIDQQNIATTLAILIEKYFNLDQVKCEIHPDQEGFSILFTPQLQEAFYENIVKKLGLQNINAGKIHSFDHSDEVVFSINAYSTVEDALCKLGSAYQRKLALQRLNVNAIPKQIETHDEKISSRDFSGSPKNLRSA